MVSQIEILSEGHTKAGWMYDVQVLDDQGDLRRHRVTLSWADYNLWSADGSDEPAKVVEAVVLFLLSRSGAHELAEKFDASIARRKFAAADQQIPKLIRR